MAFIILPIFFATAHAILKIEEYHLEHIQSRGAFRPIVDQQKYLTDYKVNYLITVTYCFVCWRESSSSPMTTCKPYRKDSSKQWADSKSRNLQTMRPSK